MKHALQLLYEHISYMFLVYTISEMMATDRLMFGFNTDLWMYTVSEQPLESGMNLYKLHTDIVHVV